MIRFAYPLVLTLLMTLLACQTQEKDPKLEAAYQLHMEALALSDSLEGYLATAEGSHWDSLKQAHHNWEAGLVEVPGFEHDHDHDHGHDHGHNHGHDNHLSELPPAEMLELQQALKDEVASMLQQAQQWNQAHSPVDTLSP